MTKTWRRGWITCDAVVRVAVAVVSVSVVFEGWGKVGRNKHGLMCKCTCLNKNPVLLLRDKTENLSQETSPHSQEIPSHPHRPANKAKVANMWNNESMLPMTKMAARILKREMDIEESTRRRAQAKLLSQRRRKDRHLKYQYRDQFF